MSNAKARHRGRYRRRATFNRKWVREGGIMGFFELMFPDNVCRELNDISTAALPGHMALLCAAVSGSMSPERIAGVVWSEP